MNFFLYLLHQFSDAHKNKYRIVFLLVDLLKYLNQKIVVFLLIEPPDMSVYSYIIRYLKLLPDVFSSYFAILKQGQIQPIIQKEYFSVFNFFFSESVLCCQP